MRSRACAHRGAAQGEKTEPLLHGLQALRFHLVAYGYTTCIGNSGALQSDVAPEAFNSYGLRRGNHEVMMRGTFANLRLNNYLVPELEGGWTRHLPNGETMAVYDAAVKYREEDTPLIVIAGKEYGHRSNLVAVGVLPLEFAPAESAARAEPQAPEAVCFYIAVDSSGGKNYKEKENSRKFPNCC